MLVLLLDKKVVKCSCLLKQPFMSTVVFTFIPQCSCQVTDNMALSAGSFCYPIPLLSAQPSNTKVPIVGENIGHEGLCLILGGWWGTMLATPGAWGSRKLCALRFLFQVSGPPMLPWQPLPIPWSQCKLASLSIRSFWSGSLNVIELEEKLIFEWALF